MINQVKGHQDKGFTLIEILVALLLVTLVLTMVTTGTFSSRRNLDQALNDIERAIRFSTDEVVLRNSLMRVHFKQEAENTSYRVQYSTTSELSINKESYKYNRSSKMESELAEKELKDFDSNFSTVQEFSDGARELPRGVWLIGMGLGISPDFETDTNLSYYIYPTGEKDSAIIILGTEEEIATLIVNPFTLEIERHYYPLEEEQGETIEEIQQNKAEELYKSWLKN